MTAQEAPAHLKPAFEEEVRCKRIVQNDLESIPMAFVVSMVSMVTGGNQMINTYVLVAFTFARVAHTYTYANQLQPHRMFASMGGVFCVVGAMLNGVVGSLITYPKTGFSSILNTVYFGGF